MNEIFWPTENHFMKMEKTQKEKKNQMENGKIKHTSKNGDTITFSYWQCKIYMYFGQSIKIYSFVIYLRWSLCGYSYHIIRVKVDLSNVHILNLIERDLYETGNGTK